MGALDGVRVIELAGIGPGPFCGMMLADMGADVVRIDRAGSVRGGDPAKPPANVNARGRRSIGVDLKSDEGRELVLRMVADADVRVLLSSLHGLLRSGHSRLVEEAPATDRRPRRTAVE